MLHSSLPYPGTASQSDRPSPVVRTPGAGEAESVRVGEGQQKLVRAPGVIERVAIGDPEKAKELNKKASRTARHLKEKNYEWENSSKLQFSTSCC